MTDGPEVVRIPSLHRLRIDEMDLVGASRKVSFPAALNYVNGEITTGKSTLVRLMRAALGKIPGELPPEVDWVRGIRAEITAGGRRWAVYRPNSESAEAPVELAEIPAGETTRVPALRGERTYSSFLLAEIGVPDVQVPRVRAEPTASLSTVSMTDWLSYCIVTGDDIDHSIFGSRDHWKDQKRRWIFEILYGLYDVDVLRANSEIRSIEAELGALEQEDMVLNRFLAGTPMADAEALQQQLRGLESRHRAAAARESASSKESRITVPRAEALRQEVSERRDELFNLEAEAVRLSSQVRDLADLRSELLANVSRLTRAVTATDYLVDFDFLVCPRCGNGVSKHRNASGGDCYLCLQPEPRAAERNDTADIMLREQERVVTQVEETDDLIASRSRELEQAHVRRDQLREEVDRLAVALDQATSAYVSDTAEEFRQSGAMAARLESEIAETKNYIRISARVGRHEERMRGLRERQAVLEEEVSKYSARRAGAEELIKGLETRILSYLQRLRIPDLSDMLTVRINRTTYLPEVSGRTFTELSSEGLKTLVNIAHALAHHTFAIDARLPLPGLLVLDGISSNAGSEGYDRARVMDAYELLEVEAAKYGEALQIIAVDNTIPNEILIRQAPGTAVVLTLKQSDRLLKPPHSVRQSEDG